MTSPSHHLIFKVTGTNTFGADIGDLLLMEGASQIFKSTAFSGGLKSPAASRPIPTETYHIRLDIRRTAAAFGELGDTVDAMHHWYGIEKIDTSAWQWEWGHFRAALNEPRQNMPQGYRGNFLHGKVRPDDYTHGCICERSEQILQKLWLMKPQSVAVKVVR